MKRIALALGLSFVSVFLAAPLNAAVKSSHPANPHFVKAKKSKVKVKSHKASKPKAQTRTRAN